MPLIKYGARFTKEKFALYIAISVSFLCISIATGTSSWLLKDFKKVRNDYLLKH